MSNNQKAVYFILILILLSSDVYFSVKYFSSQKALNQANSSLEAIQIKKKYLDFDKLFINKMLKANGTVDVDTRLELEIAARDLKDADVLAQWKKFIDSSNEKDSQEAVKNLLGMLAEKETF